MKRKIIPLLVAVSALTACSIIIPSTSSSSASSSSETSSTETTTSEDTTSTETGTSEETTSEDSSEVEESSVEEASSSSEASSSEEESDEISIEFNVQEGTEGIAVTSFEKVATISGASVSDFEASNVYQTSGTHVRFASSRKAGSMSITFAKTYQIKSVVLNAKSYNNNGVDVDVAFGEDSEAVTVSSTQKDYATFDLAGEGTTLTLSSSAGSRFYLYGITLYVGEPDPVYPTSIEVTPSTASLSIGNTRQLNVSYAPSNTNIKELTFSSSDSSVASVSSDGLVTAVNVGSATITVSAKGEHGDVTATANFTITEKPVVDVTHIEQTYVDYTDNCIYELDSCPTSGDIHPLVIPIWFTDSDTYITSDEKKQNVHDDIEATYFGSTDETGWHSVKTYYEAESDGLLEIDGVTADWYECGKASTAYYSSTDATSSLVESAVTWYFSQDGAKDRTYFDSDSDGYMDAVLLIYGAPDYYTMGKGSASNLWAYCYWLQDSGNKSTRKPGPNTFFWASYDFIYSSSKAKTRAGTSYGAGDTENCSLDAHTFIHEMGHVFGLEDYYDYGDGGYTPAGGFSMQDCNVGGHDPYSVMAYGWADPYIPTESCEITLHPFQSNHDLILLTPEWNEHNSPFDEYLLLELYTPTGLNEFDSTYIYTDNYPKGPSVAGIRLWHVDARLIGFDSSTADIANVTTDCEGDYLYGVYHAFSNTYGDADYGSVLGEDYLDYNLLQLIRNSSTSTYKPKDALSASSLFRDGDTFTMDDFSKQFVKGSKLNSGVSLGWEFDVAIEGTGENALATITLRRE